VNGDTLSAEMLTKNSRHHNVGEYATSGIPDGSYLINVNAQFGHTLYFNLFGL
jgi:hypothetical protein